MNSQKLYYFPITNVYNYWHWLLVLQFKNIVKLSYWHFWTWLVTSLGTVTKSSHRTQSIFSDYTGFCFCTFVNIINVPLNFAWEWSSSKSHSTHSCLVGLWMACSPSNVSHHEVILQVWIQGWCLWSWLWLWLWLVLVLLNAHQWFHYAFAP